MNSSGHFIQPKQRLTTILGAFLETAIHEFLYLRSLYPHDAFSQSRHLQIAVHACRHPEVVDYIFNNLKIAVPSIVGGFVDALYLVFFDEADGVVYERYGFEFDLIEAITTRDGDGSILATSQKEDIAYKVEEIERGLRDVLLSIISLDGTELGRRRGEKNFTDTTTFKICIHTKEIDNNETSQVSSEEKNNNPAGRSLQNNFCPELKNAVESGEWLRSDRGTCQLSSKTGDKDNMGTRPLKSLHAPSSGIRMQVLMDIQ